MTEKLVEAIVGMREEEAIGLAREALEAGTDPIEVMESCRRAVEEVGRRYEEGEYFLAELMLTGQMLSQISELAKAKLSHSRGGGKKAGQGADWYGQGRYP